MSKTLLVIVGPTASGKTGLSISLAKHFNCEIISCDSRQFYKEIPIGTAAPDDEERSGITHHFIGNKSITETYSAGAFEEDALMLIDTLFKTQNITIMVGGSGLFIDAVCKGLDAFPDIDASIREGLNKIFLDKGLFPLQEQLKKLDSNYYQKVDLQNHHRIIRALEVCIGTGKTYSSFRKKETKKRPFNIVKIGLEWHRETLYNRINQRVEKMINQGLEKEALSVIEFRNHNALQTVGYKEMFAFFDGKMDLKTAIAEIQKNSRRYAKRQLTWFRKDEEIQWFDPSKPEMILKYLHSIGLNSVNPQN